MEAVKGKICCCLFSPLDKFIVSTRYRYIQIHTNENTSENTSENLDTSEGYKYIQMKTQVKIEISKRDTKNTNEKEIQQGCR